MKKRILFKSLVRHHCLHSDEEQFEVFRWMIKTGWEHRYEGRWGSSGVFEWLYGLSSTSSQYYWYNYGFSSIRTWRTKLKLAFLRAIIDDDCPQSVIDWRIEQRIYPDAIRVLDFNLSKHHHDRQHTSGQLLCDLFTNTKLLTTQLNPCHAAAVEIKDVILTTNGDKWLVNLKYGFDHSSWTEQLSYGDHFIEVLEAAVDRLSRLTKPRNQEVQTCQNSKVSL